MSEPNSFSRLDAVFKAYDVRGLSPSQLEPDMAYAIGRAFARFVDQPRIVVGRDMRETGVALTAAFARGALDEGVAVTDLGLASTDMLYFATGALNSPGAVFTASHNPAQYNGIKMCLANAAPIGSESGLFEIRDTAAKLLDEGVPADLSSNAAESVDMLEQFAQHVCSFVDVDRLRPLKIVADTANGMGGLVVPAVFAKLPMQLEILFQELDGTFPNHPADPLQEENLADLQRRVLETGADVGLAFDGDADRVFLVDNLAQPVSGSTTTAMVAAALLDRATADGQVNPKVIHNLICSKSVPEVIRERGGVPVRTRVGHSFIKSTMAETNAIFGGEHSGHYYFRDNYRADSGLIAAVVVLGMLSESGESLSDARKPFERYVASGEINSRVNDPAAVIADVAATYAAAQQDTLDGLTVDFGDWWFNLRASNTEPLLRLNLEAADAQACQARTDEVLSHVRKDNS